MNPRIVMAAALIGAAYAAPARAQTDTTATPAPARDTARVVPSGTAAPERALHPRRSFNQLTYEEVRGAHVSDAWELVHNLRPAWLRTPRGATSFSAQIETAVFQDGVRLGGLDALHDVPITTVRTLRLYTASEARQKFGGDTSAGAIEVLSQ